MSAGLIAKIVDGKLRNPDKNIIIIANTGLCQCKICGAIMQLLTHCHAGKHGYTSKEDMIADGKVKFLGIRNNINEEDD